MANETIAAFKASEKRMNEIQRQVPPFSGNWRIVPNGFQLDVSHGADYAPRILSWAELESAKVSEIAGLVESAEKWCMASIEFTPPQTTEATNDPVE